MMFELVLDLSDMSFYDDVPYPRGNGSRAIEVFTLLETDWPLLNESFIDPVNHICDALLDYGDVDFFDPSHCVTLSSWLEEQINSGQIQGRLLELYSKLNEYAKRAIKLHTGVVVEL